MSLVGKLVVSENKQGVCHFCIEIRLLSLNLVKNTSYNSGSCDRLTPVFTNNTGHSKLPKH